MNVEFYKFMLVTNKGDMKLEDYLSLVKICILSGVTSVQLREKVADYDYLLYFGRKLKEVLSCFKVTFIVNDNINLASSLDADGLHLGQDDGDPMYARKILGSNKIIGISVNSKEDLLRANDLPIDYVGVGAIFPTISKVNVKNIWGLKGLRSLSVISRHPIVAIGGLNESNISSVMSFGASGVAVISAIHNAKDIKLATTNIYNAVMRGGNNC